ncbi:MAG: phosphoesterase, partial [Saprospiraceae bacterium]
TFTDRTHVSRTDINGTERVYESFNAAAEEAAFSSMYAGHNFRSAIENGRKQGVLVGKNVLAMQFRK